MKDDNCICDVSDLYPEITITCKRKRGSLKINRISIKSNGKMIRLIRYRILRFFTPKRDRDINGMLNNIWKFCEPDYYNCSNISIEGHVCIGEILKRRKILKEMSKNLYEPTSSKYPNDLHHYVDQLYKSRINQIYGIVGGKRHDYN